MVSVAEATAIIHQHALKPTKESVKAENLEGRILAESIKADRDFPPFDRVAMDGIAIRFESYEGGWRDFLVEGTQPAGQPRLTLKDHRNCIEAMTGAMLPIGCDTVIPYEEVTIFNKLAKVKSQNVTRGQAIHGRAHDAKRGEELLSPGMLLSPAEVALLVTVGRAEAQVYSFPPTAIISTGNELVDVHDQPQPHQIRRSNSYALQAALTTLGCRPQLFHLTDERNAMERELSKIFTQFELIILTGGVSKGKFDFVPAVMEELGVEKKFHQVSQRPGKPFWFGVTKKQAIFALPGNPVSSFLCFYRYIRPWLLSNMGLSHHFGSAVLAESFEFDLPLTYFVQVRTEMKSGKLLAYTIPGGGSGDFANLKNVDGFLELPLGVKSFPAGEAYPFIPFRPTL